MRTIDKYCYVMALVIMPLLIWAVHQMWIPVWQFWVAIVVIAAGYKFFGYTNRKYIFKERSWRIIARRY